MIKKRRDRNLLFHIVEANPIPARTQMKKEELKIFNILYLRIVKPKENGTIETYSRA